MSLPGAAVWHVPWHSKDDTLDWQAYFTERNRLITALMYSPYQRGGNMLKESLFIATKHALAMQYSTAELMLHGHRGRPARPGAPARRHDHEDGRDPRAARRASTTRGPSRTSRSSPRSNGGTRRGAAASRSPPRAARR